MSLFLTFFIIGTVFALMGCNENFVSQKITVKGELK